jgi:hypothetical protein
MNVRYQVTDYRQPRYLSVSKVDREDIQTAK